MRGVVQSLDKNCAWTCVLERRNFRYQAQRFTSAATVQYQSLSLHCFSNIFKGGCSWLHAMYPDLYILLVPTLSTPPSWHHQIADGRGLTSLGSYFVSMIDPENGYDCKENRTSLFHTW